MSFELLYTLNLDLTYISSNYCAKRGRSSGICSIAIQVRHWHAETIHLAVSTQSCQGLDSLIGVVQHLNSTYVLDISIFAKSNAQTIINTKHIPHQVVLLDEILL